MGIDCSTKTLAYSVFKGGKLFCYGEVDFSDGDIYRRMHTANSQMLAVVEMMGHIDAVYFEPPVYLNNRQTVILLSYMVGAALSPLLKTGTQVYPTSVLSWQKELNPSLSKADRESIGKANDGRSKSWIKDRIRAEHKQRGIEKVKELFDVEVRSNDVSDAILIGEYGVRQWQ